MPWISALSALVVSVALVVAGTTLDLMLYRSLLASADDAAADRHGRWCAAAAPAATAPATTPATPAPRPDGTPMYNFCVVVDDLDMRMRRAFERIAARFGRIDAVVNNAGILRDRMLVNMAEQEWDAVIHVHLKGHFVPTRFATAYDAQVQAWVDASRAGTTTGPSAWDGYRVAVACQEGVASLGGGGQRTIDVPPTPAFYA